LWICKSDVDFLFRKYWSIVGIYILESMLMGSLRFDFVYDRDNGICNICCGGFTCIGCDLILRMCF